MSFNIFTLLNYLNKKGISGLLPRHLVDILAGILYIYNKEYPQLINCILNTILIKNEFQPFAQISTTSNQNTTIPNQSLTRDTKLAFIDSMKRYSLINLKMLLEYQFILNFQGNLIINENLKRL